ncbi:MAG: flagellar protein FlaG [Treponema sp.]|nr:flagellar protein FlaG [Treponema sp.]
MNTISSIGQNLAMEGQDFYNSATLMKQQAADNRNAEQTTSIIADGAHVAQNIVQSNADVKADVQELQKLSDMVMGRKLQFNVNEELGNVVIKIVDPNTNKVIKEIPSADIQKLKIRIRKAIGLLFDEMI